MRLLFSNSGISDLIGFYGSDDNDETGFSHTGTVENGQFRVGASLWQRPDLYLKNSPIFYADRVTTPILIMANKHDYRVPYQQGIKFFKALRSMGKKAWLLQYDNGSHTVDGADAKDPGIRMMQFLDHYLLDKPAPFWMTRGIPPQLKGQTMGYNLDTATPGTRGSQRLDLMPHYSPYLQKRINPFNFALARCVNARLISAGSGGGPPARVARSAAICRIP